MGDRNIKVGGVGIVAFVALCVVTVLQVLPDIESGIVDRTTAALDQAGIEYVSGSRLASNSSENVLQTQ